MWSAARLSLLCTSQDQLSKKVESLERLLGEERDRAKAAERQMEQRVEQQTAITDDAKIWHREKDILQQEVCDSCTSARTPFAPFLLHD